MPMNNDEMDPDEGESKNIKCYDYKRTCIDFIEDISEVILNG